MAKQKELDGMEAPHIEEIELAAEAYVNVRDRRMKLTTEEVASKLNLLTVVPNHEKELEANADGDKVYRYDDEIVILKAKRNVKVKAARDDEADDQDE